MSQLGEPENPSWSLDRPRRATRCAHALIAAQKVQHKDARVGVHAGAVTRVGARRVGDGAGVSRAIARSAQGGEVWVSRVVRDLMHEPLSKFAEARTIEVQRSDYTR